MSAMRKRKTISRCLAILVAGILSACFAASKALSQEQPAASAESGATKALGTIKSITGRTLTLAAQTGDISVTVMDGARLLRIPPGQTDLKQAAPLALEDLQTGDRILARGKLGPDGKTLLASSVIAMKQQDIADKEARERAEWQQHSVGGLVSAEDRAAGTVTLTVPTLGAKRNVVVHISKGTILRRYAPDSVKFADAKPSSSLDQIAIGDQLRARGTRSPDGNDLSAEEVVSGSFRNIAGTIARTDAAAGTITVNDLATKKPVDVKVTGESQLRRLPPGVAQQIAARLKGASGESDTPNRERPNRAPEAGAGGSPAFKGPGSQGGRAAGGAGAPDFQQVISRLPAITLRDLQKDEAVMLVSTAGTSTSGVTAITLFAGVEPILTSPKGQSILTPWSLNTSGDTGQP